MAARFTWSRQPSERGLARICQGPRGFDLKRGGKVVGNVRPRSDYSTVRGILDWYWTATKADGQWHNSLWVNETHPTPDEAKAACLAYARAQIATKEPE